MSICCRLTQPKGIKSEREREVEERDWAKTRTTNYQNFPYQVLCVSSRKPGDNQSADKSRQGDEKTERRTDSREGQTDRQSAGWTVRQTETVCIVGNVIISSGIAKNTKNPNRTQTYPPTWMPNKNPDASQRPTKPQCQWERGRDGGSRLITELEGLAGCYE